MSRHSQQTAGMKFYMLNNLCNFDYHLFLINFSVLKGNTYILLIGLLVFLGETASIPYVGVNSNVKVSSCKMHKDVTKHSKKGCCSHGNKKMADCVDCPLCYLTVATPFFTRTFVPVETKKLSYNIFKSPGLSAYHNETWKPPDA